MNNITEVLRKIKNSLRLTYYSIGSSKSCPICKWAGHSFIERRYSYKPASIHLCPSCGSAERHRFAYLSLRDKLDNYKESVLHIAPEKSIEPWLRSISGSYLSIDLNSPLVMKNMDIRNLELRNGSCTLIWCSHVLEHIDDDKKAMSELFRVLRDGGAAIVMVPVYGDTTYEDASITSPQDRLKHFKQEDHLRLYGLDIKDRLEGVGFNVESISTHSMLKEDLEKYELEYPSTKEIFVCTKDSNRAIPTQPERANLVGTA